MLVGEYIPGTDDYEKYVTKKSIIQQIQGVSLLDGSVPVERMQFVKLSFSKNDMWLDVRARCVCGHVGIVHIEMAFVGERKETVFKTKRHPFLRSSQTVSEEISKPVYIGNVFTSKICASCTRRSIIVLSNPDLSVVPRDFIWADATLEAKRRVFVVNVPDSIALSELAKITQVSSMTIWLGSRSAERQALNRRLADLYVESTWGPNQVSEAN